MKSQDFEYSDRKESLFGEPTPLPNFLFDLAKEYSDRTEAYDLTVCTGGVGVDGVMPATPRELGMINRNALQTMRELERKAEEGGYTRQQLRDAIVRHDAWAPPQVVGTHHKP